MSTLELHQLPHNTVIQTLKGLSSTDIKSFCISKQEISHYYDNPIFWVDLTKETYNISLKTATAEDYDYLYNLYSIPVNSGKEENIDPSGLKEIGLTIDYLRRNAICRWLQGKPHKYYTISNDTLRPRSQEEKTILTALSKEGFRARSIYEVILIAHRYILSTTNYNLLIYNIRNIHTMSRMDRYPSLRDNIQSMIPHQLQKAIPIIIISGYINSSGGYCRLIGDTFFTTSRKLF